MHRPRIRFAHQVLALQVGVVTLVVGVGFILVSYLLDDELTNQYRQRALAVARTVAADASIAAEADRTPMAAGPGKPAYSDHRPNVGRGHLEPILRRRDVSAPIRLAARARRSALRR